MLQIKTNQQDFIALDIRRLHSHLLEKKASIDRIFPSLEALGPQAGMQDLMADEQLVRDLKYVLGENWETIARGTMI